MGEQERISAAVRLFQGNRILFIAALPPPPNSWEKFVTAFKEHLIDQARSIPSLIRLTTFAKSTKGITADTLLKLKTLAKDASLDESEAVQLILYHLPKDVFLNAENSLAKTWVADTTHQSYLEGQPDPKVNSTKQQTPSWISIAAACYMQSTRLCSYIAMEKPRWHRNTAFFYLKDTLSMPRTRLQ